MNKLPIETLMVKQSTMEDDLSNKITFVTDEEEEIEFFVLEETTLNGIDYILVTEDENAEEAQAYIMKVVSAQDAQEVTFEVVDDEIEMMAIAKVFEELLEDVDIISE